MRAVEGNLGHSLKEMYTELEEPRLTATVGPAKAPFQKRETGGERKVSGTIIRQSSQPSIQSIVSETILFPKLQLTAIYIATIHE
jgi:hypothetical protein